LQQTVFGVHLNGVVVVVSFSKNLTDIVVAFLFHRFISLSSINE
jgi:hypothetical protein